jgi:hypothetical protein
MKGDLEVKAYKNEKDAQAFAQKEGGEVQEKYFESNSSVRKNSVATYSGDQSILFPRMYWNQEQQRIDGYKRWSGYDESSEEGTAVGKDGQRLPTMGENISYFLNYQVNWMYVRYFMWNFAGRQNDIQGHGDAMRGNWLSGISFIDEMRLGSQENAPYYTKENKSNNKFFLIPLILGILGLFFHFYKAPKDAFVLFLAFIFTGLAIVVYLNQKPFEPRERDYAYAGSFYFFAFWIGISVYAMFDAFKRLVMKEFIKIVYVFLGGLVLFAVIDTKGDSGLSSAMTWLIIAAGGIGLMLLMSLIKKIIPNENSEAPDATFNTKDVLKEKLMSMLSILDERERAIVEESYEKQRIEIIGKYQKERKEKEKEFVNKINKINEETRIAGIKDLREKERAELEATYREQLLDIKNNENVTFEQRLALTIALRQKQRQEELALQEKFDQEDLQKESTKLLTDAANETTAFEKRLKLIKDRKALENQIIFASKEEQDNFIKENEEATTKVLADQYGARIQLAKSVGDALGALTDVVGKETAAGKALAIAQATINTFLGITEVWKSKAVLPEPFNTASKIAATVTTAAGGFAAVRNIAKTKVPGAGGGGATPPPPPGNLNAPMQPGLSPAVQGQALNAQAINDLGNQSLRAYVMNSDIQNNNQRNAYLERNARIG